MLLCTTLCSGCWKLPERQQIAFLKQRSLRVIPFYSERGNFKAPPPFFCFFFWRGASLKPAVYFLGFMEKKEDNSGTLYDLSVPGTSSIFLPTI